MPTEWKLTPDSAGEVLIGEAHGERLVFEPEHYRWVGAADHAAALAAKDAEIEKLRMALGALLQDHVDLIGSGDCGFFDAEEQPEVIAARAALEDSK